MRSSQQVLRLQREVCDYRRPQSKEFSLMLRSLGGLTIYMNNICEPCLRRAWKLKWSEQQKHQQQLWHICWGIFRVVRLERVGFERRWMLPTRLLLIQKQNPSRYTFNREIRCFTQIFSKLLFYPMLSSPVFAVRAPKSWLLFNLSQTS